MALGIYTKIPINPEFYLRKGDYSLMGLGFRFFGGEHCVQGFGLLWPSTHVHLSWMTAAA